MYSQIKLTLYSCSISIGEMGKGGRDGLVGLCHRKFEILGPVYMVQLDGPISMAQFLKKSIYKIFGPSTGSKPNVDRKE